MWKCGQCQNKGAFLYYRYRYFTRGIDTSYRSISMNCHTPSSDVEFFWRGSGDRMCLCERDTHVNPSLAARPPCPYLPLLPASSFLTAATICSLSHKLLLVSEEHYHALFFSHMHIYVESFIWTTLYYCTAPRLSLSSHSVHTNGPRC